MKNKLNILTGSLVLTSAFIIPKATHANLLNLLGKSKTANLLFKTATNPEGGFISIGPENFKLRLTKDPLLNDNSALKIPVNSELKMKSQPSNKLVGKLNMSSQTQDIILNKDITLEVETLTKLGNAKTINVSVLNNDKIKIEKQKITPEDQCVTKTFTLMKDPVSNDPMMIINRKEYSNGTEIITTYNLKDPNNYSIETSRRIGSSTETTYENKHSIVNTFSNPSGHRIITKLDKSTGASHREEFDKFGKIETTVMQPNGDKESRSNYDSGQLKRRKLTTNNDSQINEDTYSIDGQLLENKLTVKLADGSMLESIVNNEGRKTTSIRNTGKKESVISTNKDGKKTTIQYYDDNGKPRGNKIVFE